MSPSLVRKRVGQVEALVLTNDNKVLWFAEAKPYLESLGLFYTIDPSYAEKSVHLLNLQKLAGSPAVINASGAITTATIPSIKTDEYIDDCNKVKGFMKSFCDIHHASLLDNLTVKTPKAYWDCLQGIGGNPDLGAANACLAVMFNGDPDLSVPDTIQAIRSSIQIMENTYGQRTVPIPPNEPSVTIKELAGVALIGFLESIPEFSAMCLNSHKLPITTDFEALAVDALAHDCRLERSEKITAGKARTAHQASSVANKSYAKVIKPKGGGGKVCTKIECVGPHDPATCFARLVTRTGGKERNLPLSRKLPLLPRPQRPVLWTKSPLLRPFSRFKTIFVNPKVWRLQNSLWTCWIWLQ